MPFLWLDKTNIMKIAAIIPARYQSTRFPGKPLVEIQGVSMIRRVYAQVVQASSIDQVIVATDDDRIYRHCMDFHIPTVMTSPNHTCGTDRIAEVVESLEVEFVINVQGDEPFIQPSQIDLLGQFLRSNKEANIATLYKNISSETELHNPNLVKVLVNNLGLCTYFSRSPLPFVRSDQGQPWTQHFTYFKHIGMYGFHRDTLLELVQLPPSSWEQAESLEQLRWLQNGYKIHGIETQIETYGIDTPEDLLRFNDENA
jgi:3-deoxy-manno-octulosonate cytidylyltransferase (CMP-KDO synthetase)